MAIPTKRSSEPPAVAPDPAMTAPEPPMTHTGKAVDQMGSLAVEAQVDHMGERMAAVLLTKVGKKYVPRDPLTVLQMDFDFAVTIPNGTLRGFAGDYLAMNPNGNLCIIQAEDLERNYKPARASRNPLKPRKPKTDG